MANKVKILKITIQNYKTFSSVAMC